MGHVAIGIKSINDIAVGVWCCIDIPLYLYLLGAGVKTNARKYRNKRRHHVGERIARSVGVEVAGAGFQIDAVAQVFIAEVNGIGIGGLVVRHTIQKIKEIGGVFAVDVIVAVVEWRGCGFGFVPVEHCCTVIGVVKREQYVFDRI